MVWLIRCPRVAEVEKLSQLTIGQKQRKSLSLIYSHALGSTTVSSIPTPIFEVSKQVVLSATDLILCWRIYCLYYEENLSLESVVALLERAGIVVAVGSVLVYTGARATQGIADEFLNLSIFGSLVSGVIAGSSTATVGLAFLFWVDRSWRREQEQPERIGQTAPGPGSD